MFHGINIPPESPKSIEEIKKEVQRHFQVTNSFTILREGRQIYIYQVERPQNTKKPFKQLLSDVRKLGYTVLLREGETDSHLKVIAIPETWTDKAIITRGREEKEKEILPREELVKEERTMEGVEKEEKDPQKWTLISLILTLGTISYAGYIFSYGFRNYSPIGLLPNIFLYVLSLFSIIAFHEFGHIFASKRHGIEATYPIFIPGIPWIGGTFGAFIRQESPPANRDELFDLGILGPLFGFAIALIVTIGGLLLSQPVPSNEISNADELPIPLLYQIFAEIQQVTSGEILLLHPVAFAGWVGFLVTGLNLLPVSQLDGGHISMAMFKGETHKYLSYVVIAILLLMRLFFMALLLFLFMRGQHPPPLDNVSQLSLKRKVVGVLSWIIIIVTIPPLGLYY
ncbi:MAG: site-2 protease family protein [Candidatus Korarchaeota archaeon]|nr:site-2 protease family protein [Candidatus Korarchaeota archaeon]NIU84431.1 hypothetical protein [Candidatus Thorarchaeota archaeon]NIW12914.1 hypothetical protein [Candidatus Thorarchaeota archaeon]NIW51878.1 hypothetical protein [Candidatus Korarchaeota archaeon]